MHHAIVDKQRVARTIVAALLLSCLQFLSLCMKGGGGQAQ